MNAKEITLENTKNQGFKIGKSIKGKGTEVFASGSTVAHLWSNFDEEDVDEIINKIEAKNIKNYYIYECRTKDGRSFNFSNNDDFRVSLKEFDLTKAIKTRFSGFNYIAVATLPKHLGYISLSKYKSSLDSQKELVLDLVFLNGVQFYNNEFFEDEYHAGERYFDLSDNDDYGAVWGEDK